MDTVQITGIRVDEKQLHALRCIKIDKAVITLKIGDAVEKQFVIESVSAARCCTKNRKRTYLTLRDIGEADGED